MLLVVRSETENFAMIIIYCMKIIYDDDDFLIKSPSSVVIP